MPDVRARRVFAVTALAVLVFAVAAGATSLDRWLVHRAQPTDANLDTRASAP